FVVDDGALRLVPEYRHADAAAVVRIGGGVNFGKGWLATEAVRRCAGVGGGFPAPPAAVRPCHPGLDHVPRPLCLSGNERAGRPRTGERDVEVIAAGFGGIRLCQWGRGCRRA